MALGFHELKFSVITRRASRLRDALADRERTQTTVQTSLREAREEMDAASVASDVSILEKGVSGGIERAVAAW